MGTFLETRKKLSIEDTGEANMYSVYKMHIQQLKLLVEMLCIIMKM